MQHSHPIVYYSKLLGPRGRAESVYGKELMSIVQAVLKWRHYLLGRKFIVRIDQRSLKYVMEQREDSLDCQKWVTKLLGFDFEIHYKLGSNNKAVDALSSREE